MHILEISSFLPPYGGYFCIEQAKALQHRGHTVRVLLAQQLGITVYPRHFLLARSDRWWEKDGTVDIYRTNFRGLPLTIRPNMKRYCKIINEMFDEYTRKYGKPDILHAHCCKWAGVAAREISNRTGIPFVITEHFSRGAYERDFGANWAKDVWARDLLKETFENANYVIPVARELVESTKDFFGVRYKWKEITNLIDVDFFAFRERKLLKNRPFRFCCLAIANGRWFYYKGYDVLIEAFTGIKNAELHIAGRNTDGKKMKAAVKDNSNIILHGDLTKEEVRNLLYESDALVLASRSEVQPLVLLEAMSTGIPVISTEVTPMSERIEGACYIVPTGDSKSLHAAMLNVQEVVPSKLISDKICNLASPDIVASKLEKLFHDTLISTYS